ncbi:SseB family protein [Streptomyces sp. NPDC055078]
MTDDGGGIPGPARPPMRLTDLTDPAEPPGPAGPAEPPGPAGPPDAPGPPGPSDPDDRTRSATTTAPATTGTTDRTSTDRTTTDRTSTARRQFAALLGEFRRTAVLVPFDPYGSLWTADQGGVRWICAFSDEQALARFAYAQEDADREWTYRTILGARLLDVMVPALGRPAGVALDAGSADGTLFPPVAGIVPDAAAVDLATTTATAAPGSDPGTTTAAVHPGTATATADPGTATAAADPGTAAGTESG